MIAPCKHGAIARITAIFFGFIIFSSCTKRPATLDVTLAGGKRAHLPVSQTLRVNLTTEPQTLDWNIASDTTASWVLDNTMQGLTQFDLNDPELKVQPALATKWSSSDHARKWVFVLREHVVWSDGVPFTAQQVLDSWQRLLSPTTGSQYSYFLFGIKNALAFNQGKVDFSKVGVKVLSPHRISIQLEEPMAYFPMLLTHAPTYPIRLELIKKFGVHWTDPENSVTLGPFVMKAWQHDRMIVLGRNDLYYGPKPKLGFIAMYMIQEKATEINLFDTGKLDVVHDIPSVQIKSLRDRPEFKSNSVLTIYYYGMNVTKPPMNNVLVRKAIAHAIDRAEIVRMLGGGQKALMSWIPQGMFGFEPDIGLAFDPIQARELLKKADYGAKKKFPRVEIAFNTNGDNQRIGENIQAQLRRNLGIKVTLKNEEWKVFLDTQQVDPPQIFRFGWQADYPDPDNFLSVMTSLSENNHTRWKNPEFDQKVRRAAGLIDRQERRKVYREAQKIMLEDDVAAIPLFSSVDDLLISSRVKNYPVNALKKLIYTDVELK